MLGNVFKKSANSSYRQQSFLLPHRKYAINAFSTIFKNIENFDSITNIHIEMNLQEENQLKSEISFQNNDTKFRPLTNSMENSVLDLKVSNTGDKICFYIKGEPMVDNLLYSVI